MSYVIIYATSGFLFYLLLHKHTDLCDPISSQLGVPSITRSYHLKNPCVHSLLLTPSVTISSKIMPSVPETCFFQTVACLPANALIQSILTPTWSFQLEHLYHFPNQHISMSDPGSNPSQGLMSQLSPIHSSLLSHYEPTYSTFLHFSAPTPFSVPRPL